MPKFTFEQISESIQELGNLELYLTQEKIIIEARKRIKEIDNKIEKSREGVSEK